MEITGLAGWFVRAFCDQEKVRSDGFREKGIQGVAQQVDHAGGWMVTWAPDLGIPGLPQLILRIGYVASYPGPVSLRRPLGDFVVG
jgi:hypothetical protein